MLAELFKRPKTGDKINHKGAFICKVNAGLRLSMFAEQTRGRNPSSYAQTVIKNGLFGASIVYKFNGLHVR